MSVVYFYFQLSQKHFQSKNWPSPASLCFIFVLFKHTKNIIKNCLLQRYSNIRSSELKASSKLTVSTTTTDKKVRRSHIVNDDGDANEATTYKLSKHSFQLYTKGRGLSHCKFSSFSGQIYKAKTGPFFVAFNGPFSASILFILHLSQFNYYNWIN